MAEKLMKYSEAVKQFDPVLGLETHVELSTKTKLFCPAEVSFGGEPNSQLTPVSLGLPGSLPVVNKTAVDYAIKLGLALHCEIAEWSQFARKNYFYPDMPRDYQISQYDKPTNGNGYLDVELDDGTIFRVPIERAHIEDDAGKNTHVGGADGRIEGADHSLVDYNRAGVPLIEIIGMIIAGLVMVLGYGVADAVLAGNIMTGILSMPANCGQFAAGVVIASILAAALYKTPARKYFTYRLDEVK